MIKYLRRITSLFFIGLFGGGLLREFLGYDWFLFIAIIALAIWSVIMEEAEEDERHLASNQTRVKNHRG